MADTEETVTIILDGHPVEAKKGEMIIAAAERAGNYIPRFCYHPRMKPVGMCRMCLVDVKGPRGFTLTPACFVPVAEGQEVVTDSPAVKKAQDGVLEFLLVNHPLDCPVCDKGGECPLQDQTLAFGPGETRMVEEKRHWEKPISLSPLVLLDRERCIQCARCTRFADEIAGDPLIDFVNRGDAIEVNTFPDEPFSSYFSGNTVQICPVGALTATSYRFKARPWDLEQVESTCTSCSVGCRVAVQSSGDRITRYLGIDSDPVNQSWLCDKGRFDFEAVAGDARLTAPKVRKNGELVEVGWGEALDAAAAGLAKAREAGGSAGIGVIGGARLANEDAYAWTKLAKGVLGTDHVDCQLGDGLPAEVVLGLPRATIDEACSASVVIMLGPDLKEELPVLHLRLRAAVTEGHTKVIELAPRSTGFTRYAAASLLYRPGEAGLLANALTATADTSVEVAGVPAASVAAARRLLHGAERVVVVLGRPSVAESGELVAEAAGVLAGLPNTTFLSALRRSNVHGALDMGMAPGVLPGRVALEAGRSWFSAEWPALPAAPGFDTSGMLAAAAEGRLGAVVLLGADPRADFPDRELARKGMDGVGFVVALDCFETESVAKADVVLPVAAYGERSGTTTNLEGRISRLGQKVTSPGVAWPDWVVAVELADRLGADLGFDSLATIWSEIERLAPSHAGITVALLTSRAARDGVVAPLGPDSLGVEPGTGRPGGGPDITPSATDTGSGATQPVPAPIDPMSDPGIDAVETQGVPAMALAPDPAEAGDAGEATATADPQAPRPALLRFDPASLAPRHPTPDAYSLRLVVRRTLYDNGTLVQHSPHLAPLAPTAMILSVHPSDLDRLGRPAGGRLQVHAPHASMLVDVVPDTGVPRGSAAALVNLPTDESVGALIDATAPVTEIRLETER